MKFKCFQRFHQRFPWRSMMLFVCEEGRSVQGFNLGESKLCGSAHVLGSLQDGDSPSNLTFKLGDHFSPIQYLPTQPWRERHYVIGYSACDWSEPYLDYSSVLVQIPLHPVSLGWKTSPSHEFKSLQLQQIQIIMRNGFRLPASVTTYNLVEY